MLVAIDNKVFNNWIICVFKILQYTYVCNTGCFTENSVYCSEGNKTQYLVTFPAGTMCASFHIPIINNRYLDKDEEFSITIMEQSLPFGVTRDNNSNTADVLIVDNYSEWLFCMC